MKRADDKFIVATRRGSRGQYVFDKDVREFDIRQKYDAGIVEIATGRRNGRDELFVIPRKVKDRNRTPYFYRKIWLY